MKETQIPSANPLADYQQHAAEIQQAIQNVLDGGRYILGEQVNRFESAFADFCGLRWCVSVNNGTDALVLALKALEIGPGDEVITVSHTAVATVAAIELTGASAVLADVDPVTYCLDPDKLAGLISPKTKAIIPVHLYGHPAEMNTIVEIARNSAIAVVEDCAQAHGAMYHGQRVGTFGDLACFSFYPTKNLGAIGDGGAVLTSRADLAARLHLLREYGWQEHYISKIPGSNTRMDELQAAILNVKLPFLQEKVVRRQGIASIYDHQLANTAFVLPGRRPEIEHAMHLYVIQTENRAGLQAFLKENGVGTGVHYPQAVHQQPAYLGRLRGSEQLTVTENLIPKILSLPMFPQLADDDVQQVCDLLLEWDSRNR